MHNESEYRKWVEYADRDIDSAQFLHTKHDPPLELICYLSQQCAEKMLKAMLVYHNVVPKKTHDLKQLCKDCAALDESVMQHYSQCVRLTIYAAHSRYPDGVEVAPYQTVEALRLAGIISSCIKSICKIEQAP